MTDEADDHNSGEHDMCDEELRELRAERDELQAQVDCARRAMADLHKRHNEALAGIVTMSRKLEADRHVIARLEAEYEDLWKARGVIATLVLVLEEVVAWRDSDGNEPFPHLLRARIGAALEEATR